MCVKPVTGVSLEEFIETWDLETLEVKATGAPADAPPPPFFWAVL